MVMSSVAKYLVSQNSNKKNNIKKLADDFLFIYLFINSALTQLLVQYKIHLDLVLGLNCASSPNWDNCSANQSSEVKQVIMSQIAVLNHFFSTLNK